MGNRPGLEFLEKHLNPADVHNQTVLEAGSFVVNFSPRDTIAKHNPRTYTGIDIASGPGVDLVCNAEHLFPTFKQRSVQLLVSFELMEHVRDWQSVISNFKNILKPGGLLFIGTRSVGFDYHGYPFDFWRYQPSDMRAIFQDMEDVLVETDPSAPGVFVRAKKPSSFLEKDLSDYRLYSVVSRRKIKKVGYWEIFLTKTFYRAALLFKNPLRRILPRWARGFIRKNILDKLP